MILIVTYDLKGPRGSYAELFEALKGQDSWWHYMAETWLIQTELSAEELVDLIRPHFREGDRLLVVPLKAGYQGLLPKRAWTWIKNHKDW